MTIYNPKTPLPYRSSFGSDHCTLEEVIEINKKQRPTLDHHPKNNIKSP